MSTLPFALGSFHSYHPEELRRWLRTLSQEQCDAIESVEVESIDYSGAWTGQTLELYPLEEMNFAGGDNSIAFHELENLKRILVHVEFWDWTETSFPHPSSLDANRSTKLWETGKALEKIKTWFQEDNPGVQVFVWLHVEGEDQIIGPRGVYRAVRTDSLYSESLEWSLALD
jgi:hypothetical protein